MTDRIKKEVIRLVERRDFGQALSIFDETRFLAGREDVEWIRGCLAVLKEGQVESEEKADLVGQICRTLTALPIVPRLLDARSLVKERGPGSIYNNVFRNEGRNQATTSGVLPTFDKAWEVKLADVNRDFIKEHGPGLVSGVLIPRSVRGAVGGRVFRWTTFPEDDSRVPRVKSSVPLWDTDDSDLLPPDGDGCHAMIIVDVIGKYLILQNTWPEELQFLAFDRAYLNTLLGSKAQFAYFAPKGILRFPEKADLNDRHGAGVVDVDDVDEGFEAWDDCDRYDD